jgi:hypothetical protein
MAKRTFQASIAFATPTALGALATQSQYMALKSASATQLTDILEILVVGISTASAVFGGVLARASTNETGAQTALAAPNSDGPNHPATAALAAPVQTFITSATNGPTPSSVSSDTKKNCGLNAFGGELRINFAPTQQFSIFGTATPFQEAALFNDSGRGGVSSSANIDITYEPY